MIVRQAGANSFYFIYTDHLGSIVTVTDINGVKGAEQNFDTWGRNRNPATWQYASVTANPAWLYRGYTGHEHVQQVALINMNGRIYDPVEVRMLSPDNYVPDPFSTQGYNRYAYAMNNSLSFVDPDGNMPVFLIPIIIGAAVGAFIGGIQADMQGKSFLSGAWKGALVGGAGGALSLIGGGTFLANVAWGAGQGVVTNGLSNILNGQNIFDGLVSSALWGGGLAVLSSGVEAFKNSADGYGFRTNEGVLKNLRSNNQYNDAIKFVQNKYGLSTKVKTSYNQYEQDYGSTNLYTGDISVGSAAFKSNSILKATIVHEYGHSILDRIKDVNGNWSWKYQNYGTANQTLANDGPLAYAQEIFNKGRMKIKLNAIRNPKLNPLFEIWNLKAPAQFFGRRWQFMIPLRFQNNVILRAF